MINRNNLLYYWIHLTRQQSLTFYMHLFSSIKSIYMSTYAFKDKDKKKEAFSNIEYNETDNNN